MKKRSKTYIFVSFNLSHMEREIFTTEDGSHSIRFSNINEQYHSKYGAIQEAKHVFIKSGLNYFKNNSDLDEYDILEVGFGTGLNALLTAEYANNNDLSIKYTGLEAYPLEKEEWERLNYPSKIEDNNAAEIYNKMHQAEWEEFVSISSYFKLKKQKLFLEEFDEEPLFNLVYFDAFGARVQPELWEREIFKAMFRSLKSNGVLVTYSAKGSVRRAMVEVGFEVEKIPGPPGKREMLRAIKK